MEIILKVIFVGLLMAVSVNDIRKMEIPNGLNLAIFLLGVAKLIMMVAVYNWKVCGVAVLDSIVGLFIVSIPLVAVAAVTKGALGGGDIKLLASSGFFLGCRAVLRGSIVGFALAGVYAICVCVVRMCKEKSQHVGRAQKKEFPLGPFLCAGLVVGILF